MSIEPLPSSTTKTVSTSGNAASSSADCIEVTSSQHCDATSALSEEEILTIGNRGINSDNSSNNDDVKTSSSRIRKIRRGKYDKEPLETKKLQQQKKVFVNKKQSESGITTKATKQSSSSSSPNTMSRAYQKHGADKPSGGIESLLPSAIGVAILICGVMAKMGFRGRATVAGIDLGTTNSVICVQAPSKGVGYIDCLVDPISQSPIIPSVVSFLDKSEHKVGPSSKVPSLLDPHPTTVVVGNVAKRRIDSHPHHTLYHAKRVIGRSYLDPAVKILQQEVEFGIHQLRNYNNNDDTMIRDNIYFTVPDTTKYISPVQVGGYVVNHLKNIMDLALGHANVRSAVICVPAKFDSYQRQQTVNAFHMAGIKVVRIVEEPTAAALAYGLHKKPNVNYIVVYDFGGGTLDVSLLYVTDGFVDVMGSDGDDALGGTDFDIAIAHYLLQQNNGQRIIDTVTSTLHRLEQKMNTVSSSMEEILSTTCPKLKDIPLCTSSSFHTIGEQLKINLSNQYYESSSNEQDSVEGTYQKQADERREVQSASVECLGLPLDLHRSIDTIDDFCHTLQPYALSITDMEFNTIVQGLLNRSIVPIERLLRSLELQPSDIDEIVMVGGTTRMPQIRTLVQQYMQVQHLNTHIDPDITIAYGAASVID